MAKRHKRRAKGASKKEMRHLRRGSHGRGKRGMEHLFGRKEQRGRKRSKKRV